MLDRWNFRLIPINSKEKYVSIIDPRISGKNHLLILIDVYYIIIKI